MRVSERAQLWKSLTPQYPHRKLGVVAWASNPNTGQVEIGRFLKFAVYQTSLMDELQFSVRESFPSNKVGAN